MATEGNAGSFRIEVEDGTAAGSEKVLRSLEAMQRKADKISAKGGKGRDASYYREAWEAEEAAATKRLEIARKLAADKAKVASDTAAKEADITAKATNNFSAWTAATSKLTGGLNAVRGALGMFAPAIAAAGFAGAVQGFFQWAESADKARKATVGMQIDVTGAREAVGGMVDDMQLAQMGNKAFAMGVVKNGVAFAGLAKGVSAIALKLGEDVGYMMDSAITAIGRGSSLVLDNLGIILSQSEALDMYAAHIGKATNKMTEFEKSQAFAYAATKKIADAGREAAGEVDSAANSIMRATIAVENFKERGFGFNVNVGKIRDNLRGMQPEILALFGSRNQQDIARINRELDRQAELQAKQARELGDTAAVAADYRVTYDEILAVADDLGHVEKMRGGQIDYENRIKREKQLNALAKEALDYQDQEVKKAAAQAAIAAKEKKIADLRTQADSLDHLGKLLGEQKGKEVDIYNLQARALLLRKQAAQIEGDKTKELEAQRAIELHLAQEKKLKKPSGGSGPTVADRLKAELDAQQSMREAELRLAELRSELTGRAEKEGAVLAAMRLDNAHAALENELAILEGSKAKNSVERKEQETRKAEIAQEMIVLGLEHEIESRKAANELIQKAIDKSRALALAEQDRQAWAIAGEQKLLAANAAQIQQRANFELALAKTPAERVAIQTKLESDLHRTRLAQIEEERKAQEAAFARRELELDPKDGLAKEQLAHDRKMAFMDLEMQKSAELDAQATRLAQAEAERRRKAIADFQEVSGAIESITGQVSGIVTTEIGRTRGIEDEAHSAKIQRMEQAAQATSASLDREINAAKGNAAQMAALRAKKAKLEEANRKAIEKAEAKHQEKRKRQEMRGAGIQLLIQGAIETGKAIAAYASYNFVQGALHTAAAALNIGYGAALISGRIPVGGGGGSGGGGGGDSFGSGVGSDTGRDTSGAAKTPESTPGEAANRASSKARPTNEISKQSGGVTFNGNVTINATGKVDKESAEAFGFGALKNVHSREALA